MLLSWHNHFAIATFFHTLKANNAQQTMPPVSSEYDPLYHKLHGWAGATTQLTSYQTNKKGKWIFYTIAPCVENKLRKILQQKENNLTFIKNNMYSVYYGLKTICNRMCRKRKRINTHPLQEFILTLLTTKNKCINIQYLALPHLDNNEMSWKVYTPS